MKKRILFCGHDFENISSFTQFHLLSLINNGQCLHDFLWKQETFHLVPWNNCIINTLWSVHSVVMFCRAFLTCFTGHWPHAAHLVTRTETTHRDWVDAHSVQKNSVPASSCRRASNLSHRFSAQQSTFLLLLPPQPQYDSDSVRPLLGPLRRLPPPLHRPRQRPRHPQRHAGRGCHLNLIRILKLILFIKLN